mgnify:CR=1 FL=1
MNRKTPFAVDEYYHIYNRGTDKREIFSNDQDYNRFIGLLYLCNTKKPIVFREIPRGDTYGFEREETIVDIGAYCLMPNHFHLLLREKIEGGITHFMKKVATGYSMYFNLSYQRTGKLMEGVFKSIRVENDQHLEYLFAYIHLNPLKLRDLHNLGTIDINPEREQNYLFNYLYSSFYEYMEIPRPENRVISKETFPEYFRNKKDFITYLFTWIKNPIHT